MTIAAKKKGAIIIRGTKEAEEHLLKNGAEASTIGDVLIFGKNVSKSAVLEETYHYEQNLQGLNSDNGVYEKYLIKNASKFEIPRNEIESTQKQLEQYQEELRKFYEKRR